MRLGVDGKSTGPSAAAVTAAEELPVLDASLEWDAPGVVQGVFHVTFVSVQLLRTRRRSKVESAPPPDGTLSTLTVTLAEVTVAFVGMVERSNR